MSNIELMGAADVAHLAKVARQTVMNHVSEGKICPMGHVGPRRIVVFDRAEAERYAAAVAGGAR